MELIEGTPFPDLFSEPEDPNKLAQGDIIVFENFIKTEKNHLGFVILSNTCDLDRPRTINSISIALIHSFNFVLDKMIKDAIQTTRKAYQRIESEEKRESFDFKHIFLESLSKYIYDEANYSKKFTYFISPLSHFENKPTIINLEKIHSINKSYYLQFIKHRITTIKSPWKEKLGFKVGFIFNRVATYTPKSNEIKDWWIKSYDDIYKEKIVELEKLENELREKKR